ncbi:MAG: hypothetical protein F6J97_11385 [Leptolyngbya sp. SIO4C1]|nr:hypothetical protein [Leptolyngbya sp. SIO4C1]
MPGIVSPYWLRLIGAALAAGVALRLPALAQVPQAAATAASLAEISAALLDLAAMPLDMTPDAATLATDTPSEDALTIPSLWWQQDQIAPLIRVAQAPSDESAAAAPMEEDAPANNLGDLMITGWIARRAAGALGLRHIDITVNQQAWSRLNYLQQYALISQLGQTAKTYGYQLRLFTGESLLGTYACNFAQVGNLDFGDYGTLPTEQLRDIPCTISKLDYLGPGSIRGRGTSPFGQ